VLIQVLWNDSDQVAEVSHRDAVVDSEEQVQAWRAQAFAQLDAILAERGGRFPLVIDVDGLSIHRDLANRYTEVIARPVGELYATAVARYGTVMQTRAVIALEDLRRTALRDPQLSSGGAYRANLFDGRQEAVRFVVEEHTKASLFDEG
jgi:hypothetical protein